MASVAILAMTCYTDLEYLYSLDPLRPPLNLTAYCRSLINVSVGLAAWGPVSQAAGNLPWDMTVWPITQAIHGGTDPTLSGRFLTIIRPIRSISSIMTAPEHSSVQLSYAVSTTAGDQDGKLYR